MATVSQPESEPSSGDGTGLLDILIDPFRHRWVRYFLGVEVFLVVGGFLIDYRWGSPTGWAEHPDFHLALGVVMAGIAIVLAAIFLVVYVLTVALTIRDTRRSRVDF